MTFSFRTFGAIGLIALPSIASALTPEAFLDDLVTLYELQGFEVERGTVTPSGDGITVAGFAQSFDDGLTNMVLTAPSMVITSVPEGLAVSFPEPMVGAFTPGASGSDEISGDMTVIIEGDYLVAEDGAGRVLTPRVSLATIAMSMTDPAMGDAPMAIDINASDIGGTLRFDLDTATMSYGANLSEMVMSMAFPSPGGDTGDVAFSLNGLAMVGEGDLTSMMAGHMDATTATSGRFLAETFSMTVDGPASDGGMSVVSSGDALTLDVAIADGTIAYGYKTGASTMTVQQPGLPPFAGEMAASLVEVNFPFVEGAREMAIALSIEDLALGDGIWGLFDPGGALPRDPASLSLSLKSAVDVLQNPLDPAAAGLGMPFEFKSVTIDDLALSAVGVALTGSGAADILNEGFMPMPAGQVEVEVTGLDALLAVLPETGMIDASQLVPVRMMMGMFLKPGGEDSYSSVIEMTEDGAILANGVQIQ